MCGYQLKTGFSPLPTGSPLIGEDPYDGDVDGDGDAFEDDPCSLIRAIYLFIFLTVASVGLRFYARKFGGAKFGWDDGLIIASCIFNVGLCVVGIIMASRAGVGFHSADLPEDVLLDWYHLLFMFQSVYFGAVSLPKLAGLCLYLRLFNWRGLMRLATLVLIVLSASTWAAMSIVTWSECRPFVDWWNGVTGPHGVKCIATQQFFHAQAVPGFILDLFIFGLPMHTIWKLKLPMLKRVGLVVIFIIGGFGMIACGVRMASFWLHPAVGDSTCKFRLSCSDPANQLKPVSGIPLTRWSITESSCYIMANCAAHFKPLFTQWTPLWLKKMFYTVVESASASIARSMSRASKAQRGPTPLQDGAGVGTGNDHIPDEEEQRNEEVAATPLEKPEDKQVSPVKSADKNEEPSVFQGPAIEGPPYYREIEGGRSSTWAGQHPDIIRVTTELSLESDVVDVEKGQRGRSESLAG
ncbi:hypothetical protein OQA88_3043 [Cercophora sp. LCS_1]